MKGKEKSKKKKSKGVEFPLHGISWMRKPKHTPLDDVPGWDVSKKKGC